MSRPGVSKAHDYLAAAVLLLAAAVCLAEAPTDGVADASSVKPSPNQSVSIEATADGPSDVPMNAGERTVAGSRLGRRRPAIGELAESDRSTPWYRTGIGALAVVLAVVGAAYWLLRRWMPSSRPADAGVLKIEGRTGLTPKHSLVLVRVGRRYAVIGVSPERLDALCEISDAEEVADLAARIGLGRSTPGSFDTLLAGEATDYQELPTPTPDSTPAPGSLKSLLGRLRTVQSRA